VILFICFKGPGMYQQSCCE